MEASKILTADILDIIFEGRNKGYGAFDLRKNYNRRLLVSLGTTVAITALLYFGYAIMDQADTIIDPVAQIDDRILTEILPDKQEVIPPPVQKKEPPRIEVKKFVVPQIVRDDKVKENEMPPENKDLERVIIGQNNQAGVEGDDVTGPPASTEGKGIVAVTNETKSYDSIFTKVEIESFYPNGAGAWLRYLNKTFQYPQEAVDSEIEGTVVVQFIIDRDGMVSDVHAVSGPSSGGLRKEAERVIQKSGKWEPAIQNGRKVKSYKRQPITFRLTSQ